ncbi:MAG: carbohydrate kinase family protein [Oscillospiraceae bacterium]|nr:carbohydrate kinase family protein [Oscillospiraceae bacterium]
MSRPDPNKRILIVGDVCPDTILPYGAMKRRLADIVAGRSVPDAVPAPEYKQGGSCGNTAAVLGKLGARPCFICCLGKDYLSDFLRGELVANGVDMALSRPHDLVIPIIYAILDETGEKTIFLSVPPGGRYNSLCADDLPADVSPFGWVHTTGMSLQEYETEAPAITDFIERCHTAGVFVSFDLNMRVESFGMGEKRRGFYERILRCADVIFGSSIDEFAPVTGINDLHGAARALSTSENIVVARDADKPILLIDRGAETVQPVLRLDSIVNKVGAGDAFSAAFIEAYRRGQSAAEAVRSGIAYASYLITHTGAHCIPDAATLASLLSRLEQPQ